MPPRTTITLTCLLLAVSPASERLCAAPDLRFDVMTLCCVCTGQMACPGHLEHLNFPTTNGHYIAMGDDDHRLELATNGNTLAIYYNTFNTGWPDSDGATAAAAIEQYSQSRFTATGPRPDWIVLNEISASLWPGIAVPPQGAVLPPGSDVAFTVYKTGIAPTTYQWRHNGSSLAGATGAVLALTNIGPQNAGSYSVVLSNAAGSTLSSNAVLSVRIPDPLIYEPFADATASGGTAYSPGANVVVQTNAQRFPWYAAGTSDTGPQPVIAAGNLNIPGLAPSLGNSVVYGNTSPAGAAPRLGLGASYAVGTLFYSFAFRLTDLASLGTGGVILAGFNNSSGAQTGQPTAYRHKLGQRHAAGSNSGQPHAQRHARRLADDPLVANECHRLHARNRQHATGFTFVDLSHQHRVPGERSVCGDQQPDARQPLLSPALAVGVPQVRLTGDGNRHGRTGLAHQGAQALPAQKPKREA